MYKFDNLSNTKNAENDPLQFQKCWKIYPPVIYLKYTQVSPPGINALEKTKKLASKIFFKEKHFW